METAKKHVEHAEAVMAKCLNSTKPETLAAYVAVAKMHLEIAQFINQGVRPD